jgi:hypothetical protein
MFIFANRQWGEWSLDGAFTALTLRLGSIAVDLVLWASLGSNAVREFFVRQTHPPGRAFEVITTDFRRSSS